MFQFRTCAALALGLLAMACTQFETVGTDTISPGYVISGGEWSSGGGITIAVRAFEHGGETMVCGAWTTDRQSVLSSELNESIIDAGSVNIGGTRVAQNLLFMRRLSYSQNLSGGQANCILSSKPWRPEFDTVAPVVRLPRRTFLIDAWPQQNITFRQTDRPDIIQ